MGMKHAALAPALALAACAAPDVTRISTGLTYEALERVAYSDPGKPVVFSHRGGEVLIARAIASQMNMRGQCMKVDAPVASAEVIVARLVDCIELADRDAPLFGIHMSTNSGTRVVNVGGSVFVFGSMGAIGCLTWYMEQPEYRTNALAYVSWNDLERGCT